MEVAGLGLGIFAATDLCIKYGRILVEKYATFKGAEAEIDERILYVQSHWKRTAIQLDFIIRIWKDLDEEHQTIQTRILQVLNGKLSIAISKLEDLYIKESDNQTSERQLMKRKKLKYVLIKRYLDESIEDLASWQKMFDPSWFLILKVSSILIDKELSTNGSAVSSLTGAYSVRDALREHPLGNVHVFLPKDEFEKARMREIPFASARCMQRAGSDKWLVVDCIPCHLETDISLLTKDVRELARKLSSVDPLTFGILRCRGVVRVMEPSSGRPSSFNFIFQVPNTLGDEPRSLRAYLSSDRGHTLTDRFRIAKQLAKSVSYVHTLGFVHKNIRPETVLGFQTKESGADWFFLVGFEKMRTADGRTQWLGDSPWEKNLYRHPHRQGLKPEDIYTMQHDIYSLGVCLLEVGLWRSFLLYEDSATAPLPAPALGIALDGPEFKKPILIKEHLVALARRDLPKRMGERYEEIVVNCLTCLDQDNADFGDQSEFEDRDGVLIGVKYIEKILLKLDEIVV
ncbi:hypothetical protein GJ744_006316 [Endocarpon pusillum]|uniref:Protein kinase domain-containing protein n=1 Tax=Endocarpon pusillum TaxID=364733 RepID=A0A8H7ASR3_9EURO|nr:hypothetical protein GJ744_006316 [Endocarpon pusillum]